jgi:flavin-dependent dehydrogenase
MINRPDYHIAIVGGGLAGLTLAIQLADAGYRVILFEKENYPFHKVCGEYISKESWNFLERCGLPLADWHLPLIDQLQVSDTKGKLYDFALSMGGFGLSRYRLDNALYQIALQKGVRVLTHTKVNDVIFASDHFTVKTNDENYTAAIVTAAFGKRSNLDVKWNREFVQARPGKLNNFIGVKYHIRYPHPSNTIALHNFSDGYCGISQIEDDACCLCYLTTAANLKRSDNSIAEMEKRILSKNRQLEKIFSDAEYLYAEPLTISQVSFHSKSQVENHVLQLGDAAGMITPLCGNGMSMAMHSGKIAFECIQQQLSGKINRIEMEKLYTHRWNKEFGSRTKTGRLVQYFFGGSFTTSVFLRSMHAFPVFSQWLIEQTHGKLF